MKTLDSIVLALAVTARLGNCEDEAKKTDPIEVKIYSHEQGLTPPTLRPMTLSISKDMKCKQKVDGKVELSLLVDIEGRARNVFFVHAMGTDVDRFALKLADDDKFIPASFQGNSVVSSAYVRMNIQSCLVEAKDADGKETYSLQLRSIPSQQVTLNGDAPEKAVLTSGPYKFEEEDWKPPQFPVSEARKTPQMKGDVHAPVPIIEPLADYTPEARKAKITGRCLVGLVVDARGMPRNMRIVQGLDPGLDQKALIAVNNYRFKPAMKEGTPVPVYVYVEVNFHLN